jgi:hypothetical protein
MEDSVGIGEYRVRDRIFSRERLTELQFEV